jgi:hypothetical protein
MYLGGKDAKTPLAAPLHADLKDLPPIACGLRGERLAGGSADSQAVVGDERRGRERRKCRKQNLTVIVRREFDHALMLMSALSLSLLRDLQTVAAPDCHYQAAILQQSEGYLPLH